ncbi:hypothetical protein GC176_14685 [bacterium]|nr:hypothetical protein [bacterium]
MRSCLRLLYRWLVCLFLVAVLLPWPVSAADDTSHDRIAELLQLLDSKSRQERAAAEHELLQLGPAVLDSLPSPDLLPSVSVRQAVSRVRTLLERIAAEQSIAASRVTLRGELMIRDIVAAIAEQTGNALTCSRGPTLNNESAGSREKESKTAADVFQRTLNVDWRSETFWNVIGQLEAAGFRAEYRPGSTTLELAPETAKSSTPAGRSQIDKAFRIDALPADVRTIDGAGSSLVRIPLRVLAEPRLRPLFLRCAMADLTLTAGQTTLPPFSPESRFEIPLGDGGREATVELPFTAPGPKPTGDSMKLSGRLTLVTAALERPITFPKLSEAKGLARRRGGVTVTVTETALSPPDARTHTARISTQIGYDAGPRAFESYQNWVFHNRVFLIDRSRREFAPNDGFSTLFQDDGTVGVEYRFRDLPEHPADWQFTYVAPTLLINVPLNVSLDGIPLAIAP